MRGLPDNHSNKLSRVFQISGPTCGSHRCVSVVTHAKERELTVISRGQLRKRRVSWGRRIQLRVQRYPERHRWNHRWASGGDGAKRNTTANPTVVPPPSAHTSPSPSNSSRLPSVPTDEEERRRQSLAQAQGNAGKEVFGRRPITDPTCGWSHSRTRRRGWVVPNIFLKAPEARHDKEVSVLNSRYLLRTVLVSQTSHVVTSPTAGPGGDEAKRNTTQNPIVIRVPHPRIHTSPSPPRIHTSSSHSHHSHPLFKIAQFSHGSRRSSGRIIAATLAWK